METVGNEREREREACAHIIIVSATLLWWISSWHQCVCSFPHLPLCRRPRQCPWRWRDVACRPVVWWIVSRDGWRGLSSFDLFRYALVISSAVGVCVKGV